MNFFLRSVSYILHPLLMPLLGAIIYFSTAPRFIPIEIIRAKVFGLIILTILIPIVLFFLLKSTGTITSIHLENVKQRKIPLLLQSILLIVVIKMVIDVYHYPELYFFFLGILFSSLSAIFMVLFNIKASLHMIGISGITMFTVALSIHFGLNLTILIAMLMIFNGLVATSRLHCKAHSNLELILGFLIGIIPQLTLANFWL
ncbi:membrane-associated HD superfamily phosphohydrolase [Aquimarina sp. EL_43]|uniref:Membrane protein n=1 Tax=Aquimarina atlantica TaxID=1317122 RepID=A0A023BWI3_9FLAO|nr:MULTISPECIES: hypothetical protein [Aquimarina]EZH74324.1 membrane protein [Aquimarina atlantica]MBG6133037.1 membrane-associated HD superfamily phosphohydrolase [Aquimarina sp. EL_35]MBG6152348.1 membrane-associated HD superfamily phosphohydrolase [Aquimarina sp. EL_32]MBG6171186.1 membrane-associated HD superfamily phosphohydrolase [Aquimarina sp. EL_43]